uniref:Rx N-terminal domain-containing protein n=1 Tax=Fagus sylvatica TaxID=28930 RepID=A0A2N9F819_FAGSY
MDILTGCAGSTAAEIGKCTAKPIIRHVGYLFRFKKTVDDLTKAKKDLQLEQQKVQEAIERAAMNTEVVEKDVEGWLANVMQLMEEVQTLENQKDYNIDIEELIRYAMGIGTNMKIVTYLKTQGDKCAQRLITSKISSLLLEGFSKEYVKMHDMVRDVALWIASKGENEFKLRACTRIEKNINLESVTAISLMASKTEQLPDKLVLTLEDKSLSSQSLQFLTNLQSLYLKNCDFSDNLSSLGKLKRLETLSFHKCGMAALPNELGEMESLRMLDLTACDKLRRIPPNVIQRLFRLEEANHWLAELQELGC